MFRKLPTLDEARKIIDNHFSFSPIGTEKVPLLEAFNRVVAEYVVAPMDIPPFDRSTVDGYAVVAEDTAGADENHPVTLSVCGDVSVGELPKVKVKPGEAAEIVTGAPIPEGADAVVMAEYVVCKNSVIHVNSAVVKGENIMKRGADIRKGETVLRKHDVLRSKEIGVLAALGLAKAKVFAVPRVAVFSTGAEITEPGLKLGKGKIYDINAYSLSIAVQESGGQPVYLGVFPDNMRDIQNALKKALSSADMVVTSGGVSVGPKDFMPKALNALGKPGVILCGIAIKPGKPATVASVDGKPVFSLPGHPASALLVFHLIVNPLIRRMSGRPREEPAKVKATAEMRMFSAKGRRTFIMVNVEQDKLGKLIAKPVATGLSGAITTLAKADGFVEIAEDVQFVDAGDEVDVQLF